MFGDDEYTYRKFDSNKSEIIRILVDTPQDKQRLTKLINEAKDIYFLSGIGPINLSILIPDLINLLSDKDATRRYQATTVLWTAASYNFNISQAIPALAKALSDGSEGLTKQVLQALSAAAKNNIDISPAIPTLEKTYYEDIIGISAIFFYYFHRKEKNKIKVLLKEKTSKVLGLFYEAAEDGLDISLYMPEIINLLSKGVKLCYVWDTEKNANISCQYIALRNFINQKKENTQLVLDEINKSKINKRLIEVKELVKMCEEKIKGEIDDNPKINL